MNLEYWESLITDIKNGKPIIITDNESRENEGDFFVAAEVASESAIRLMLNEGRGLICTPISSSLAQNLDLEPMVKDNNTSHQTAFTVSIDHTSNSTGISLSDRLTTIKELANKNSIPNDFLRPGHIFPLIAKDGGVLEREGHTEAAIDLVKMAKLNEVGVICEILNDEGAAANKDELMALSEKYDIKVLTIQEIIEYKKTITEFDKINFPTKYGDFDLYNFKFGNQDIIALKTKEGLKNGALVRVHSECKTGDIFGSMRCDCGDQLDFSLQKIFDSQNGLLIYLNQEGRGIGFRNKIKAYKFQEEGLDTYQANEALGFEDDLRDYSKVKDILKFFKINDIELITNNPMKIASIKGYGINISRVINTEMFINVHNSKYLLTKKTKTNHSFINNQRIN